MYLHRHRVAAVIISVIGLIFAITASSLRSMIVSDGLVFGLNVKTEIGIFSSKQNQEVIGVNGEHVHVWQERCNDYNQTTSCGVARMYKCNVNKSFICIGCIFNTIAVVLCLVRWSFLAKTTSVLTAVAYTIVIGVVANLRYGNVNTINNDCGYNNAFDIPNVTLGTAFHFLVVAACLNAVVCTLMIKWESDNEKYDKNQVYPFASETHGHSPAGNSLVSTLPPSKPVFPDLPGSP